MKTSDFYYDLPERLIAQSPLLDRSASRLLTLNKETGEMRHKTFRDIAGCVEKGDCLVLNETKVIPARLIGWRKNTHGKVEVLLLKKIDHSRWETLVYPGKKMRPGDIVEFGDGLLTGHVEEILEDGNRIIRFNFEGIFEEILDQLGEMPLPPYITGKLTDKNRYQTVYAKNDGSAAAPTAGLHFTENLIKEMALKGVHIAKITLHVGLGTFRPVKVDNVLEHKMHAEFYEINQDQAEIINRTKSNGGKVIAVGTTSCRTLESCTENGVLLPGSGWIDTFIYPGYTFKMVDALITNFHLPESTLIMLVSALAGKDHVLKAYEEAVMNEYRFFSFGDAMFIY